MTGIPDRVLVRASMGFPVAYVCRFDREGRHYFWTCGSCNEGRFSPVPHVGDKCPVCHFIVADVAMLTVEMLERRQSEWEAKLEYMRTFGGPEA